jgi:hypothetical protein
LDPTEEDYPLNHRTLLVRSWCAAAPARCSAPSSVSHVLAAVISPLHPPLTSIPASSQRCSCIGAAASLLSLHHYIWLVVGLRMDCEPGIELYERGGGWREWVDSGAISPHGWAGRAKSRRRRESTSHDVQRRQRCRFGFGARAPVVLSAVVDWMGPGVFLQIYQHADGETTPVVRGLRCHDFFFQKMLSKCGEKHYTRG